MDPDTSLTSAQEVIIGISKPMFTFPETMQPRVVPGLVFQVIYLRLWGPLDPSGGRSVSFFPGSMRVKNVTKRFVSYWVS